MNKVENLLVLLIHTVEELNLFFTFEKELHCIERLEVLETGGSSMKVLL